MITEAELLGPRAHGPALGVAQLKATAEDFQVDEVLDIPLEGEGEHLWLWVEKRNLNTEEAARRLARAAGVPARQVSYAGLKDRQALTRQWFSLHLPGRQNPDLSAAEDDTLAILSARRHRRKLQRGAHSANGFIVRLAGVQAPPDQVEARLQLLRAHGVPNYYGLQRFGHGGGNVEQALHYAHEGRLPDQRNVRSRVLSAARSQLFNRVLAERVRRGDWDQALPGDLLAFTDSKSFFLAGPDECQDPRLAILDLHPTGPLWGQGQNPAQGDTAVLEDGIASAAPQLCNWLAMAQLSHERRILRLPIGRMSWHYPVPDILQLEFVLPSGCFATAVVRELFDLGEAGQASSSCVF